MDVKGAYDNLDLELLISELEKLKLPRKLIKFIKNLISKRDLIPLGNLKNPVYTITKGLPLGSVLSPILYAIYTNLYTPINVILAETKIPYLKHRFKYLGLKYILKCLSYKNNPMTLKNLETLNNLTDSLIYENNFEKSLLFNCYEQTWFHRDLIIQSDIYYKF